MDAPTVAADAQSTRVWTAGVLVGLLLTCVGEWLYVRRLPLPDIVNAIPDDSFFFLRVAQLFWSTGEFTFDGAVPTYGFQPLWQLVLISLQPFCGDAAQFFYGTLLLCCLLHVATGGVLFLLGRAMWGNLAGLVAAASFVANPAMMLWCWGLKENALYALLLALSLLALQRVLCRGVSRGRSLWLGLALGLCVFTRVNAVLAVAGVLLAVVAARGSASPWRARLRAALLAGCVAAAVAVPWYAYAWLHFGSVMPISGTWKMALMRAQVENILHLGWLGPGHLRHALGEWPAYLRMILERGYGPALGVLAGLFALAVGGLPWRRLRPPAPARGAGWVVSVATLLALAGSYSNQLCLHAYLGYADWYTVPEYVALPLLIGWLAARAAPWLGGAPTLAAAAAVLAATWFLVPGTPSLTVRLQRGLLTAPPRHDQLLEMGLWAARHVPDGACVGIWDPGIVSYFAGKRFLSMDPLMNSLHYQQVEIFDPLAYVAKHDVAYMFGAGELRDGQWCYQALPPGSYDVVWLPYPDHPVAWGMAQGWRYMVVRPLAARAPEFLRPEDFPCGVMYPNDAARSRQVTRDLDRLRAGVVLAADVLRIDLTVPAGATPVELRIDGSVVHSFPAGTQGWQDLDVRAWRGARAQLVIAEGGGAVARQAHLVDFTFPWR